MSVCQCWLAVVVGVCVSVGRLLSVCQCWLVVVVGNNIIIIYTFV